MTEANIAYIAAATQQPNLEPVVANHSLLVHWLVYACYRMPIDLMRSTEATQIMQALWPHCSGFAGALRTYALHTQYVRCVQCNTYYANSMGIQQALIVGCRKCELRYIDYAAFYTRSKLTANVAYINGSLLCLDRQQMLSFNQLARTLSLQSIGD